MDKRPMCGAVMLSSTARRLDPALRHALELGRVRCSKDPGHSGNHACQTKRAYFEWWNEADNPQRRTT